MAFSLAIFIASFDISIADTLEFVAFAKAILMHPLPEQISIAESKLSFKTHSTNSSVSGLGINVE